TRTGWRRCPRPASRAGTGSSATRCSPTANVPPNTYRAISNAHVAALKQADPSVLVGGDANDFGAKPAGLGCSGRAEYGRLLLDPPVLANKTDVVLVDRYDRAARAERGRGGAHAARPNREVISRNRSSSDARTGSMRWTASRAPA